MPLEPRRAASYEEEEDRDEGEECQEEDDSITLLPPLNVLYQDNGVYMGLRFFFVCLFEAYTNSSNLFSWHGVITQS